MIFSRFIVRVIEKLFVCKSIKKTTSYEEETWISNFCPILYAEISYVPKKNIDRSDIELIMIDGRHETN